MSFHHSSSADQERSHTSRRVITIMILVAIVVMGVLTYEGSLRMKVSSHHPTGTVLPRTFYPVGIRDSKEPSGYSPPSSTALPGYTRVYVNDFNSGGIPKGWTLFNGVPGGDPGARFLPKHVTVKKGELVISAYRDPSFHDRWATGGLCQCGAPQLYGAYFVRSRSTAVGPNNVELLWPENNQWPPEIDFNETPAAHQTTATVHWGFGNSTQQWIKNPVNMLAWNTWGVVWTPTEILYTLNGHVWGIITNPQAIPRLPMRLDFEQRTQCTVHAQCPKVPVAQMQVDWVVEYHLEPNS